MRIRVFGGLSHGSLVVLDPKDKLTYVLGRNDDCDIKVDDNILSKRHCTFQYNSCNKRWQVADGDLPSMRSSLNGTWMYLSKEFVITDNMTFKCADVLFQATLINN